MSKEIERTWLCSGFLTPEDHPEITYAGTFTDSTSYLFVSENLEIRIRKRELSRQLTDLHWITVKVGNGLVREEYEEPITAHLYEELRSSIPHPPVISKAQKMYALINVDGIMVNDLKIYISETDGRFFRAEIEFPDAETAEKFVCPFPDWKDVTGDPRYAMKNYWVNTRIKGEVYNGK